MSDAAGAAAPKNRYDLAELAGAFGDLGTLIPFVVAYVSVVKMDPAGMLLAFGSMLVVAGLVYRTPFPVQPMKAIGAAAITQGGALAAMTSATVVGAGIVTGLLWLLLAATGLARRLTRWVPKAALLGVVMGLGFSFMLEGTRMMAQSPWLGAAALLGTLVLLARSRFPAMLVLLAVGAGVALLQQPTLWAELAAIRVAPRLPSFAWPGLTLNDLWVGAIFLALPQLPLTFGNALIAITEENNRLFPDRPVTERRVAFSTGLMNLWSSALGGIPMCHGAGGMAGHVQFGAHTGGASVMLGRADLPPVPAGRARRDPVPCRRAAGAGEQGRGQREGRALRRARHRSARGVERRHRRGVRHPRLPRDEARLDERLSAASWGAEGARLSGPAHPLRSSVAETFAYRSIRAIAARHAGAPRSFAMSGLVFRLRVQPVLQGMPMHETPRLGLVVGGSRDVLDAQVIVPFEVVRLDLACRLLLGVLRSHLVSSDVCRHLLNRPHRG
jgi:hypothetical protein